MQIVFAGEMLLGVSSWTTGLISLQKKESVREEAHKNLLAVVNRLILEGREDEAEAIFDEIA